jgi:predicted transcriptional regulator
MGVNKESEFMKTIYGLEKVMTISDLKNRTKVSEITIRRKLKKSGAITSYNRNGKFYTLPDIPKFDINGLWNYKDIRFSKFGNLNQTIIQLVNNSPGGLYAEIIGELIAYQPHSLLNQLCLKSTIQRQKSHGKYVYFSIEEQVYKSQFNKHTSLQRLYIEDEISCIVAVRLLIEKIRKPKSSLSDLVKILHKENIKISELQANNFFEKHGIEKKTLDLK